MTLNESVAREVMGWPVVESTLLEYDGEPGTCCFISKHDVLRGSPYRILLGKDKWTYSWGSWTPSWNIAQAFEVIDEVLSWEWDNPVWFEMSIDGKRPFVQLMDKFEVLAAEAGKILPEVICKVALWAWRYGGAQGRSEDV